MARQRKSFQRKSNPPTRIPSAPPSRLTRFRSRAGGFVSTTKRKALAVGLAGALALGSWGVYRGIQIHRFNQWKENVVLQIQYGRHDSREDLVSLDRKVEQAKRAGKPFDFFVIENSATTHEKRMHQEKLFNEMVLEIGTRFSKELNQNNLGPIEQAVASRMKTNEPEFMAAQFALAARHHLRIKMAESYDARQEKIVEQKSIRFHENLSVDRSTFPTPVLLEQARETILLEREMLRIRNESIAKTTARVAAEIRQANPALRKKTLRGIVRLGSAHIEVTDLIQRQNIRGLSIQSENTSTQFENPCSELLRWSRTPEAGHPTDEHVANLFTITKSIQPLFVGFIKNQQTVLANELVKKITALSPSQAQSLIAKIELKTGRERGEYVLRALTGEQFVIRP